MADEELFGLDDELPAWTEQDLHDVPADDEPGTIDAADDEERAATSLPAGVTLLPEGQAKYYSQRVTAPPMVDCMFAALCTPLSFMGYGLPPTFVGALRKASGVPLRDAAGRPQGTTTAASRKALRHLLPDAPVRFGGLDDETMLARLKSGEVTVRLMVTNQKLPPRLRRFVGRDWVGLHAVALGGARRGAADGRWEVRWMDPAGRPAQGYDGEFVSYADIKEALKRTPSGKVCVTFGEKNAAPARRPPPPSNLSDEERIVKLLTNGRIDEFAAISRGGCRVPARRPLQRRPTRWCVGQYQAHPGSIGPDVTAGRRQPDWGAIRTLKLVGRQKWRNADRGAEGPHDLNVQRRVRPSWNFCGAVPSTQ